MDIKNINFQTAKKLLCFQAELSLMARRAKDAGIIIENDIILESKISALAYEIIGFPDHQKFVYLIPYFFEFCDQYEQEKGEWEKDALAHIFTLTLYDELDKAILKYPDLFVNKMKA